MLLAMNGSNLLKATGFTGFGMIIVFMYSWQTQNDSQYFNKTGKIFWYIGKVFFEHTG